MTTTGAAAIPDGADYARAGVVALASAVFVAAAAWLYWPGLAAAASSWSREEYSYGYMVPFVAAYLLWRRLPRALETAPDRRWVGVALAALAAVLGVIGALSRIADLAGYGFIVALVSGSIAVLGLSATRRLWVPFAYLLFMLPLPQVVYLKLSAGMQLVSSELGVGLIRLLGIPVLLAGNVIDLGNYRLQVAEACSGLRYLFPLMSFGFLFAVLYRGPTWQKWTLFLSTVPITIAMNSVRIAVIGVLVAFYGIEQAEGFLHFFEGWVIFLGCVAVLFAEAVVLLRLAGGRRALRDALDLGLGPAPKPSRLVVARGAPLVVGLATLMPMLGIVMLQMTSASGANALPERRDLVSFPSHIAGWTGQRSGLPSDVSKVLAADDYLLAHYARDGGSDSVNLFMAYYDNQTDGRAVHSPEVCLLGDGWEIRSFTTIDAAVPGATARFPVNRAIVQKGLSRALVYYWFEGRGRRLTNEYVVKWHILADGITRNRTDGALVRLVTPLLADTEERVADARLVQFMAAVAPSLSAFLPP